MPSLATVYPRYRTSDDDIGPVVVIGTSVYAFTGESAARSMARRVNTLNWDTDDYFPDSLPFNPARVSE